MADTSDNYNDFLDISPNNPTFRSINNANTSHLGRRANPRACGVHVHDNESKDKMTKNNETEIFTDAVLKEIPTFYKLQKNHTNLKDVPLNTIVKRFSNFLQKMSIHARFNPEKAHINATTLEGVNFRINMFKSKEETAITVEVHQLLGSSLSFKEISKCLLLAAKGITKLPQIPVLHSPSPGTMEEFDFPSPSSEEQKAEIVWSLKQCEIMIDSKKIDSILLGMEMLRDMTDEACTFHAAASCAAKAVLGGNSAFHGLRNKVFSFVANNNFSWEGGGHELPSLSLVSCRHIVPLPVLNVLVNALTTLKRQEKLKEILDDQPFLCDEFIVLLLKILKEANTRPHDAYWAAKCVTILVRESNNAQSKATELEGVSTLTTTRQVGKRIHQLLAEESDLALVSMRHA